MTRKITGTESDTHSGNKLGLLYPNTPLYDKDIDGKTRLYHPNLTAVQEYLYELREVRKQRRYRRQTINAQQSAEFQRHNNITIGLRKDISHD